MVFSNETSYAGKRARRSHRKSRRGCNNCKARRVKCDELKPTCSQCSYRSTNCDYVLVTERDERLRSADKSSAPVPTVCRTQAKDLVFISSSQSKFAVPKRPHRTANSEEQQELPSSSSSQESALSQKLFDFSPIDMALFHHCLSAEDLKTYIPQDLLRLGFSFHSLLHLFLSVSGFHLSRNPDANPLSQFLGSTVDFHSEAVRHLRIAIANVATTPSLNPSNRHALYAAAVYIFICSLASGPSPNEYLAFRNDGDKPSLCLFLGLRTILEDCNNCGLSMELSSLHSEIPESAGVNLDRPPNTASKQSFSQHLERHHEYLEPLENLGRLISSAFPPGSFRNSSYRVVLDSLASRFRQLYGESRALSGSEMWPLIFSWLYTLPDCVVHDMEGKQSVALLLFGFFAVLLDSLDSVWFIRGWTQHIAGGIFYQLDDYHRAFFRWPLIRLGLSGLNI